MTYRILDLEPERIPHHRSLLSRGTSTSGTHLWGSLLGQVVGWLVAWTEANVIHSCGGVFDERASNDPSQRHTFSGHSRTR
jgi:hypothetical protein